MRVAWMTAAAAACVVAEPASAAKMASQIVLTGNYTGGSPIVSEDGLVPQPAPLDGTFRLYLTYGLGSVAYGFGDGVLTDSGGASFNVELGSVRYNEATGQVGIYARGECICNYKFSIVFAAQPGMVRGFNEDGSVIFQSGRRYYLTDATSSFGGTVSNVSLAAVPEPATWALMILGFGAVGGALRRRRSATLPSMAR